MQDPEHLRPAIPDQRVILIADDEVMIRNVARITLEAEGYFILAARDGQEALQLSRTFPGRIHLLLSDVKMPNMDGLELRERFLSERPETAVLLMSGQLEAAAGNTHFLRKPFAPGVLTDQVRRILNDAAG